MVCICFVMVMNLALLLMRLRIVRTVERFGVRIIRAGGLLLSDGR